MNDTPALPIRKVFDRPGDFASNDAAERWLSENGYSVGSMQRGAPRGIMRGDYSIAKWRNLSRDERTALHGTMTAINGTFRSGAIMVEILR